MYKSDTSLRVNSFPEGNKKFEKTAIELFSNFNSLIDQIKSRKYTYYDLPSIIKLYKYKLYYDQKKRINFNSYWDEIDDSLSAEYYSEIISIEDSLFRMKYYSRNGTPLFEGNYTSFYPHKKTGLFIWFYENGEVRKTIHYKNNKTLNIQIFHKYRQLHYDLSLRNENFIYNQIYDSTGNKINSSNFGSEIYFDSVYMRKVYLLYNNNLLKNAYYLDTLNRKIFLIADVNSTPQGIKIKPEAYPVKSLINFEHGTVLVKCIINPSGFLSDCKIVKGLSKEIDELVLETFNKARTEKLFSQAKNKEKNVFQEIVIPVNFNLEGFSNYRTNYYYNNFDFMFQQRMVQNQQIQMNNAIRNAGFK